MGITDMVSSAQIYSARLILSVTKNRIVKSTSAGTGATVTMRTVFANRSIKRLALRRKFILVFNVCFLSRFYRTSILCVLPNVPLLLRFLTLQCVSRHSTDSRKAFIYRRFGVFINKISIDLKSSSVLY